MVVVCYIETIVLGVNRDNVAFHKKGKKKTLLLTDSPNSLIWCQWRGDDYDFTYLINLYLFVKIIQGWSFFIPNLLSSCHFLGVEESLFWQSHSSTGTECGGSSWAAVGPEYRQNHKWVTWLTTKACTDLNFFSRSYFHHCLRTVHYCEVRFHIHFLNRNSAKTHDFHIFTVMNKVRIGNAGQRKKGIERVINVGFHTLSKALHTVQTFSPCVFYNIRSRFQRYTLYFDKPTAHRTSLTTL